MNLNITLSPINNCLKIGLFFLIIKVMLGFSTYNTIIPKLDSTLSLIAIIFLVLHIFQKTFTIKLFFIYAFIMLLSCISSYLVGNTTLFITVITVLAIHDEKDIISFLMKYEFLIVLIIISIFVTTYNIRLYNEVNKVYGFYYVFSHPNVFSCIVFNIIIMWIWCNYERLTTKNMIFVGLLFIGFYLITKTKTILLVGLCSTVLITIALKGNKQISKLLSYITGGIIPLLSIVFYWLISNYNNTNRVILAIDKFLTGRIRLGAYAYYHYGSTLFGQYIEKNDIFGWDSYWQMSKFTTFDNMYTMFIVRYGIIWLVLLSVIFYLLAKKNNNRINCMLIIWSVYAITEAHIINGYLGFPVLLSALLLEKKQAEIQEIKL